MENEKEIIEAAAEEGTQEEETAAVEEAAEEPASEMAAEEEIQAEEPVAEADADEETQAEEPAAEEPAESMDDMAEALEKSYSKMGDGHHDTDALIAWEKLIELCEAQTEMEVEISGIVKKGVIAMVEGVRGFIPASRLSLSRVEDLNDWLGKKVRVIIITADKEADRLVLSAREILRRERDDARQQKRSAVKVGSVLTGNVESILDYGAFVDLGDGVSGLVHVSQISQEHVKHPSDVLKEGQEVQVKVIGNNDGKIKLSMKALTEQKEKEEETSYKLPKTESVGTSMGDLLRNIKL